MDDQIEVSVHREQRQITLLCSEDGFSRLRQILLRETNIPEEVVGDIVDTRLLLIATKREVVVPGSHTRDRIALFVCGVIAFAFLFVFFVGVSTIAGWLR